MARSASASDAATDAASPVLVLGTGPEDGGAVGGAGGEPASVAVAAVELVVLVAPKWAARDPPPDPHPAPTTVTRAVMATMIARRTPPR
jgi:hypothetical protein